MGTPFFPGDWQVDRLAILSHPDSAWMRVPLVRAALLNPAGGEAPKELQGRLDLTVPGELRVTQGREGPYLRLPLCPGGSPGDSGTPGD